MPDNDLTLRIGADASGVEPGAAETKTQVEGIDASVTQLTVQFKTMAEAAVAGFEATAESAKVTLETVTEAREAVMGLGEAFIAAFAVEAFEKQTEQAIDFGAELSKTAGILGVSTTFLQEFNFAAKQSDIDVGAAQNSLKGLNEALGAVQANLPRAKQLAVTFAALGFTPDQLRQFKDVSDLFPVLADRIAQVGDASERAAIARKLGIGELIPMLNQGANGFDALAQKARDLGVVLDESTIAKAEESKKRLSEVDDVVKAKLTVDFAAFADTLIAIKLKFGEAEAAGLHFIAQLTGTVSPLQQIKDLTGQLHSLQAMDAGGPIAPSHIERYQTIAAELREATSELQKQTADRPPPAATGDGSADQLVATKTPKGPKPPDTLVSDWESAFKEIEAAHTGLITNETADELVFWNSALQQYGLTAKEKEEIEKRLATLRHTLAVDGIRDEVQAIRDGEQSRIAAVSEGLATEKAGIDQQFADLREAEQEKLISHQQAEAQIDALIGQRLLTEQTAASDTLQAHIDADNAVMAHFASNTEDYKAAVRDLQTAWDAYEKSRVTSDNKAWADIHTEGRTTSKAIAADWNATVTPMVHSFTSGLLQMATGMQSFAGLMRNLGMSMANNFLVNVVDPMLTGWVRGIAARIAAAITGNAIISSVHAAGAAQTAGIDAVANLKSIEGDAAKAAAKAYAAMSGIPPAPLWGVLAGAAAFTSVMAFEGMLPSAAGGWGEVPNDQLAMVHKREMILPAGIADWVREAAEIGPLMLPNHRGFDAGFAAPVSSGGSSEFGGGGETHVHHHHYNINAIDGPSLQRVIQNNPHHFAAGAEAVVRGRNGRGFGSVTS